MNGIGMAPAPGGPRRRKRGFWRRRGSRACDPLSERISAVNTLLTALYLGVLLPILGVSLPAVKTLIVLTFLAGLLPVVGNLISNTVIVIVSLAHSPGVALGSLVFLIVVHKLEYFLNARIVGTQIKAKAWELLLAMLVMESAFGMAGLIAAPIYYAYLKDELASRGLI
jgi:predicted PurR-regulated permease PerM